MSLNDLTTQHPQKPTRSLAWLLPTALIIGFLIVLALLFGERLIPAINVNTAPVITIRTGEDSSNTTPTTTTQTSNTPSLLFQASGWIEPDPYTTYASSLINGVIHEVHILEGQTVKKGQLLATLIDDDAKLNLRTAHQKHTAHQKQIIAHCTEHTIIDSEIIAANSQITAMEAQRNQAQDNSDRLSKLPKGSISEREATKAKLTTEMQVAMLSEAQAQIPKLNARKTQIEAQKATMEANLLELATSRDRAQLALDRTKIKAPMDGIILKLHAAPGMKRMLDMDSPTSAVIAELYDPTKLQARIDVPLNEAAALSAGQTVELISDLLPDKTFTGTVTRISGQADLQRNTLQAKVQINNPDPRLRPDMLMRAKFYSTSNSSNNNNNQPQSNKPQQTTNNRLSIYVPQQALINDTTVWVVTPDLKAEKRTIQLGTQIKEDHQLVTQGLRSGESVILPPHHDLKNGTKLNINITH